jgi:pimeloyl-ACP methyl ester carboxylesterase
MPRADVAGLTLSYETAGDGGSPVVLIMGLGLPGAAWAPQRPALATRHRVLTFDNRGAGSSDKPFTLYSTPAMARDTIGLVDHLAWERAHVVGISLGGMVAQELALSYRDRVRSLTLIATHPGGGGAWLPSPRGLALLARINLGGRRGRLEALQRLLLTPEYRRSVDPAELTRRMRQHIGTGRSRRGALCQLAAVLRHRTARRLPTLGDLPTLVLQPLRDIVIHPRHSVRLARAIPGAQLVAFPQAGHGLTLERPGAVNRLLLGHFRRAEEAAR